MKKRWPKRKEIKKDVDFINELQKKYLNRFYRDEKLDLKSAYETLNDFNKIRRTFLSENAS